MRHVSITIEGFITGPIWQGIECYKTLNYSATDQQARTIGKMTLRDHALRATIDGDFQHCVIAAGTLHIDVTTIANGRRISRSRSWPLSRFPSIADTLHSDPEWLPLVEEPA
jgi:hypothetical protein